MMTVVLESVAATGGRPVATLSMRCRDTVIARMDLAIANGEGAVVDARAVAEQLRDFADYLMEWSRHCADLVARGPAG